MSYVVPNYPTKKAFKEAVAAGIRPATYNPSGLFPTIQEGIDVVEGPHYPKPHRWYATVTVVDGRVTSVE